MMRFVPGFMTVVLPMSMAIAPVSAEVPCPTVVSPNCPLINYNEPSPVRVFGCTASVQANWSGVNGESNQSSCVGTVPAGTILVNVVPHDISLNNGNYQISRYSAGLDFHYDAQIEEVYDEAISVAAKDGDKDREAKLTTERDKLVKYVQNLKTNQDGVQIQVSASTQGNVFDRKGGHATASADLMVSCISPVNLREQVAEKYKFSWPKTTNSADPEVVFDNTTTRTAYLSVNVGPKGTDCNSGRRYTGNYTIAPNDHTSVSLDVSDDICWLAGPFLPRQSTTKNYCLADTGDKKSIKQGDACYRTS